jgi:NDP-sugar pyrophosphorylase family protein
MKAMILAAGLGTRLRPLTNDRPKALVEVGGKTLLEITLRRLSSFGIRDVIINVYHFADLILEYLKKNDSFGMTVEISREEILLDTGGGLKRAAWFFREDSEPFILHNVDVISTIDLKRMVQFHAEERALATLAMQGRKTSRVLLFDEKDLFRGRQEGAIPEGMRGLAFSGIHVISPQLLTMMCEEAVFSIIDTYTRLASRGQRIVAFRADEYSWRDLGKLENVAQAQKDAEAGLLQS